MRPELPIDRHCEELMQPTWLCSDLTTPIWRQDTPVIVATEGNQLGRRGDQPRQSDRPIPVDQPALGTDSVTDYVRTILRRRKLHYPVMPLMDRVTRR